MIVLGICGWSGSGKTDLVCRLIKFFTKNNLSVSTLKHTHHNIEIDKKGKDSFNHSKSGAKEVLVGGGSNWTLIHRGNENKNYTIEYLINKFSKDTDILLIEGFKNSKIPKLEVFNNKLQKPLIHKKNSSTIAIIYDKLNEEILKTKLPNFSFKKTKEISNFIINYFEIKKKNEK
tara:strand:+ start:114 stop:638 length:525 start_codon:yes stop_codon:yes gene_type:complete